MVRAAARRPVEVDLPFRAPLEPADLLGHLVHTGVPGVEEWRDGAYRRTALLPGGPAVLALAVSATRVRARLLLSDPQDEAAAVALARRLLDLDADPLAVAAVLSRDPVLAPLVGAAPGRRVPGVPDMAEMAVRAVLGQQVSTAAARTHAGRLARAFGAPLQDPEGGLVRLFPTPSALAALRADDLALPHARRRALLALVRALAQGPLDQPGLLALPGIGPWTASTVALRALGDRDAFLPTDLGVRRAAAALGLPASARPLLDRASAWQPYRAYALVYLWAALDHPALRMPD